MALEPLRARKKQRREHEGERHDGAGNVSNKDEEVHRADETLTTEARISMKMVVDDVAREKEAGDTDRREHQLHVEFAPAGSDREEARDEQHRAREIEPRVQSGKSARPPRRVRAGVAKIEQPEKERDDDDADDANDAEGSPLDVAQLPSSIRFTSASAAI